MYKLTFERERYISGKGNCSRLSIRPKGVWKKESGRKNKSKTEKTFHAL